MSTRARSRPPSVRTGRASWTTQVARASLGVSARLVAGQLADHADRKGRVTLPVDELARRCCLSPAQTSRALDELDELGWLVHGSDAVHLTVAPKGTGGSARS